MKYVVSHAVSKSETKNKIGNLALDRIEQLASEALFDLQVAQRTYDDDSPEVHRSRLAWMMYDNLLGKLGCKPDYPIFR